MEFNDYAVGDYIDRGAFAEVYMGTSKLTGEPVAIKIYNKISKTIDNSDEYNFYHNFKDRQDYCPYNIKYIDGFMKDDKLVLVMEYFNSKTLEDKLLDDMSPRMIIKIFKQCLLGVKYLHENNVVHRDIKSVNILVNDEGDIKIIDFGFATSKDNYNKTSNIVGSPIYMPYQTLNGQINYEDYVKTDLWGLGVTFYELLTKRTPFTATTIPELKDKICRGPPPLNYLKSTCNDYTDKWFETFVRNLLNYYPQNRLTLEEALIMIDNPELIYSEDLGLLPECLAIRYLKRLGYEILDDKTVHDILRYPLEVKFNDRYVKFIKMVKLQDFIFCLDNLCNMGKYETVVTENLSLSITNLAKDFILKTSKENCAYLSTLFKMITEIDPNIICIDDLLELKLYINKLLTRNLYVSSFTIILGAETHNSLYLENMKKTLNTMIDNLTY